MARKSVHQAARTETPAEDNAPKRPVPRRRKRRAPDMPGLVNKLERVSARLIGAMETSIGTDGGPIDEKDVRALGAMAATLAKVIDLKPAARQSHDTGTGDGNDKGHDGIDFDDPQVLDAISERLERLAAAAAAGADLEPDDEGAAGLRALLADVRAGRPTGA